MNKTNISWADYSWNPITGCTKGCSYCYARKVTERWPEHYPHGFKPIFHPDRLKDPFRIKKPSIVFVGSMGDLFDPAINDGCIKAVFGQMQYDAPWHTYMILTKQADRMVDFINHRVGALSNQVFGVTVTCMDDVCRLKALTKKIDRRIRKFASFEPLLDGVLLGGTGYEELELVIVGGQTPGKPLHETHPDWLDSIIDECSGAGVPVHYKHAGRGDKNPSHKGKVYGSKVEKK